MSRAVTFGLLFAGVLVLSCSGPTRPPLDTDDAGASTTGGSSGSHTGGYSGGNTGGGLGTGGSFDTGGSSGTEVDAGEQPDARRGGGDGGRRQRDGGFARDGGFGSGSDGGRRQRDGGGGTRPDCPAGTMNGAPCAMMGELCALPGGTGACACRAPNGGSTLTWRCFMR